MASQSSSSKYYVERLSKTDNFKNALEEAIRLTDTEKLEKNKRYKDYNCMETMVLNLSIPLEWNYYRKNSYLNKSVYDSVSDYYDTKLIDELNKRNYCTPVVYVDPDMLPFVKSNVLTSDANKDDHVLPDEVTETTREAAHFVMMRRYLKFGNMRDNSYYWEMVKLDDEEINAAEWINSLE